MPSPLASSSSRIVLPTKLDFGGRRFDDGQGAAAFGRVLSGLDVVRKIQQQPVNGQNLTPPVPIVKVVRSK